MAEISIVDIGPFSMVCNGSPIHINRRKSIALLLVLALSDRQTLPRERLVDLLWSNSRGDLGRTSLRQEVSKVRAVLGEFGELLVSMPAFLCLSAELLNTVSKQVLTDLKAGKVPDELLEARLPQERFLSCIYGLDAELDMWISIERNEFEDKCQKLLTKIITTQDETPLEVREQAAKALTNLDSTNETALACQVEALVEHGAMGRARKLYEEYCDRLSKEYGLTPSPQLSAKMGGMLANNFDGLPHPATSPHDAALSKPMASQPRRENSETRRIILAHSIRASQTIDLSGAQGVRLDLLGKLARFRDWSVREYFEDGNYALPPKWFELKFHCIEDQGNVALVVSLEAMPSREIILTESIFVRDYLQSGASRIVVRKLANSFSLEISARSLEMAFSVPESDRDLIDRWILAQQRLINWRADHEAEAEKGFRAILAKWPEHYPSMVSLVEILNTRHHVFPGLLPDPKRCEEAMMLAHKAVRLSTSYNRAHNALGWCQLLASKHEQAKVSFKNALRLNDADPSSIISAAMGLCYCNEKEEARQAAEQAMVLAAGGEPIHWAYHAAIRFLTGDLEAAYEAAMVATGAAHHVEGLTAAIAASCDKLELATQHADNFVKQMQDNWYSSKPATRKNIRNWLMASFPIMHEEDRHLLSNALTLAGLK